VFYCIVFYCIVFYYIVFYCIVFYCRNVPGVAVGIVRTVRPECARERARGMSTVLQKALYE